MITLSTLKSAFETLSTVLVALAAAFLLATQIENRWLSRPPRPRDVKGLRIEAAKVRHVRGTGPVAVIEFTDYECPFCRKHNETTDPEIRKTLIETGIARHVVFNFPLEAIHQRARKASEAAECAARQGRYWEMHERLFHGQHALSDEELLNSGEAVGVAREAFTQCLKGQAASDVATDLAEGSRLGVNSTPTFFIGVVQADGSIRLEKRLNGAMPFSDFKEAVEAVRPAKAAATR